MLQTKDTADEMNNRYTGLKSINGMWTKLNDITMIFFFQNEK